MKATTTEATPPKKFDIEAAPIVRDVDLRDGAEYRAKAREMPEGGAVLHMPKEAAGKLYRAIEEYHGARTASQKAEKDGTYSVMRVAPRELRTRTRKTKTA